MKKNIDNINDYKLKVKTLENRLKNQDEEIKEFLYEFLSLISHEVRTPLNAIYGFSRLITDQNLDPEKKKSYSENIIGSCDKLLDVFDKIIDLSYIRSGRFEISEQEFCVNELMNEIYKSFNNKKHLEKKESIALILNKGIKEESFIIRNDPAKIQSVMTNLIKNAFKNTDKGVVEFGYSAKNGQNLNFFINDTRRSNLIPPDSELLDQEPILFPPGNTDLEITHSREVVRLLGGKLWTEINTFKGNSFNFSLPHQFDKKKEIKPLSDKNREQNNICIC